MAKVLPRDPVASDGFAMSSQMWTALTLVGYGNSMSNPKSSRSTWASQTVSRFPSMQSSGPVSPVSVAGTHDAVICDIVTPSCATGGGDGAGGGGEDVVVAEDPPDDDGASGGRGGGDGGKSS